MVRQVQHRSRTVGEEQLREVLCHIGQLGPPLKVRAVRRPKSQADHGLCIPHRPSGDEQAAVGGHIGLLATGVLKKSPNGLLLAIDKYPDATGCLNVRRVHPHVFELLEALDAPIDLILAAADKGHFVLDSRHHGMKRL